MSGYVLIRRGKSGPRFYVANPGHHHSYTIRLEKARVFETKEKAQAEACGNESAVPVSSLTECQS